MLYPKEDRVNSVLNFSCRTCSYTEPASTSCIMRNELQSKVGETAGVTQDVAHDPTVGAPPDTPVPSFCTMCGQEILCPLCGQETDNGFYLEAEDPESLMTEAMDLGEFDESEMDFEDPESSDPDTPTFSHIVHNDSEEKPSSSRETGHTNGP